MAVLPGRATLFAVAIAAVNVPQFVMAQVTVPVTTPFVHVVGPIAPQVYPVSAVHVHTVPEITVPPSVHGTVDAPTTVATAQSKSQHSRLFAAFDVHGGPPAHVIEEGVPFRTDPAGQV